MKTAWIVSLLLPLHALAASAPASPDTAQAVKKTFELYRTALVKHDGKAASALLDARTLEHYQRMGKLALEADAATLKQQPLPDQLFVLQLRDGMDLSGLKKMDGKAIFQHAVTAGWIGADAYLGAEPGDVTVDGPVAKLGYSRNGKVAPTWFEFRKDKSNAWKLDLLPTFEIANIGMKLAIQNAKVPPEAFLLAVLERSTGRQIPDSIWDKPEVK